MIEYEVEIFPGYILYNTGKVFKQTGDGYLPIKPKVGTGGYCQVLIPYKGRLREKTVHNLVAEYFLEPSPDPKWVVKHIDGNPSNNHVNNLEWGPRARLGEKRKRNDYGQERLDRWRRSPNGRYSHLKNSAKRRKLSMEITFEKFCELIKMPCFYCGETVLSVEGTGGGIDRRKNADGYTESNVVPCCCDCNVIKNDILTEEEMMAAAKAIKEVRKRKGD